MATPWAYHIAPLDLGDLGPVPRVIWDGEARDKTANHLLIRREPMPREQAEEFLKEFLKDGPRGAEGVAAAADAANLALPTIRRAQKALGIEPIKAGKAWVWGLRWVPASGSAGGPGIWERLRDPEPEAA